MNAETKETISIEEYKRLDKSVLTKRINRIRSKCGSKLLILSHHYQKQEIFDLADAHGDSFQLSQIAAQNEQCEAIFFCGVHFMAETADILANSSNRLAQRNGKRINVYLPDLNAGCPMADFATLAQVEDCWSQLADVIDTKQLIPITYVNSKAEIKAFCGRHGGLACTSSNAKAVLQWAFSQNCQVLFLPDQHLGRNTAIEMGIPRSEMVLWSFDVPTLTDKLGGNTPEAIKNSRIILWNGYCKVHQLFAEEQIEMQRSRNAQVKIIVHPECNLSVVQNADISGSTSKMIEVIGQSQSGSSWAVGTEWRMIERLIKENPDKQICSLASVPRLCESMNMITLANLCWALENWDRGTAVNLIRVPDAIAQDAGICLERMLDHKG